MNGTCLTKANALAACLHGCLHSHAAGCLLAAGQGTEQSASRSMAVVTLVVWLSAESLGAYMLSTWIRSGAARDRHAHPGTMSMPVLASHASMALSGLLAWSAFLITGSVVAGWLGIGLLAVGIGLGISTVTLWTPYPGRRRAPDRGRDVIPDDELARALADEAAAVRIVDDLLARNLAVDPPGLRIDPRAIIPAAHGVLALVTFFLATLAAAGVS
jgi:hypothetical protein